MARRIKEEPSVHRKRIADAAEKLFITYGIEKTTVSMIAESAGYSKATIYVYFENKEEIVAYLVLNSMALLKKEIYEHTSKDSRHKENYYGVCEGIINYKKKYPMYFSLLQDVINVDFSAGKYFESEKDTYIQGEEINNYISELFALGDDAFVVIFTFWASICGILSMADKKTEYIEKQAKVSKKEFVQLELERLYRGFFR
ncbi:transcriptional regulator, TetR family [Butyrivibrio sp. INlla18]|uniref:TetR/AcrR family transcriptional regulator n=1 Tax=Butyrivibrio sp. INlla18 TaxID=1520806 RepID=UPI000880C47E|nr:TetR/AcrR family transcriptional regulator [Butyrivibrio sp. INlla18]SDA74442.1 transcriptional regulator, TetR family [Butyrivibrio sp. INlla18]